MKLSRLKTSPMAPPLFALLAMVICLLSFYPGAMTWDSLDQLRQARANRYLDWQPPIMALVWRQLLLFTDGPGGMLLFHTSMLFAAGVFLYHWSLRNNYRWSFMFLLLPFLPWIINFEFVIWKDAGLAYSWLLATSMAIYYSDRDKFPAGALLAVALLFLYGFLVRANSIFGAIFLLPFLASCIRKKNSFKFFALTLALSIALFAFLPKTLNKLLSAEPWHPESYAMFDDLVALNLGKEVTPTSLLQEQDISALKACDLLLRDKVGAPFCINDKFEDVRKNHLPELKSAWSASVLGDFMSYLYYRLGAFLTLTRTPLDSPYYPSEFRIVQEPYLFDSPLQPHSMTARMIIGYEKVAQRIFPDLFKPYFWLFASLLVAGLMKAVLHEGQPPFWMLPLSGFSYVIGYLPITPAADFRYAYWLCLVATASFMLWATIRFKTRREYGKGSGT